MEHQYQPLDTTVPSIRLLTLIGFDTNGELTLSLRCSPLEQVKDSFSALSYTWGDDVPSKRIWIDGAWMLVRDNLWDFLQHCANVFFPKRGPMQLWTDAICINQQDIPEKNMQVRMMGEIYDSAREVLVWLGPASRRTAFARDWEEFCENRADFQDGDYFKKLEAQTTPQEFYPKFQDLVDDVWQISTSKYWQRLWIQQEIFLARRASIIVYDTTWDIQHWQNEDLALCLRHPDYDVSSEPYKPAEQTKILLGGRLGAAPMILKALQHCCDKQCSDLRDKVFGLLAMSRGRYRDFDVDYHTTVEELAKKTLPLIIKEMMEHVKTSPIRTHDGQISQGAVPIPAYWLQISLQMTAKDFILATSLTEANSSNFGDLSKVPKEDAPYIILVGGTQAAYIDRDHPLHKRKLY